MLIGLLDGCPLRTLRVSDDEGGRVPLGGGAIARLQTQLMTPFRWIGDDLRLTQRWKLFPVANADRYRMWIEGRAGAAADWQLLYRPHDDVHTWLSDDLEYRRLRGAWNPGTRRVRGAWPYFASWVARVTFLARPELTHVRVRMEQLDLDPRREGDPTGATGTFRWEELIHCTKRQPCGWTDLLLP